MNFCLAALILIAVAGVVIGKETVVYKATGSELVDLIRGYPPKDGALKLSKVEGDTASLPDGIYYVPPEDEALEQPEGGDSTYLYLNRDTPKKE